MADGKVAGEIVPIGCYCLFTVLNGANDINSGEFQAQAQAACSGKEVNGFELPLWHVFQTLTRVIESSGRWRWSCKHRPILHDTVNISLSLKQSGVSR